jgi:hypothetical protein
VGAGVVRRLCEAKFLYGERAPLAHSDERRTWLEFGVRLGLGDLGEINADGIRRGGRRQRPDRQW